VVDGLETVTVSSDKIVVALECLRFIGIIDCVKTSCMSESLVLEAHIAVTRMSSLSFTALNSFSWYIINLDFAL